MSFFGGFNDPFFGDMHRMMHRQMRDMEHLMDGMMVDPFGMMGGRPPGVNFVNPRQQMIADGGVRRANPHPHPHPQHMDPMTSMMMQPFGFGGGGLFGGMRNMMQQMEQVQQHVMTDPNSHVYTQSTVVAIGPGADGRPQVYEATDSVRKAGDVKETRRTVRDTARGEERMSVGHHIGTRGHVIEKRRDKNNRMHEAQEFIGVKEDEAHKFDKEWNHATRRAVSGDRYRLEDGTGGRRADSNLAIEAGPGSERIYRTASPHDTRRARIPTSDHARRHSPYQHTPPRRRIVRVEEPPDEPTTSEQPEPSVKAKSGGPIIEEIE